MLGVVLTLLATILISRACSGLNVWADLVANLTYFLVIPLIVLVAAAASTRQWFSTAAGLLTAFVGMTPFLAATGNTSTEIDVAATVSVLHCNIRGIDAAWSAFRALIETRKPDIVSVVETSDSIVERIRADEGLRRDYPATVLPRPGLEWPQVVLSRHSMHPLPPPNFADGTRMHVLFSSHRSNIIMLPAGPLIFSTEHVPSPRSASSWAMGNEQVVAIGHLVRDHYRDFELPILITGDFNSSPSGYRDGLMRRETGLMPNPESFPPVGTWPSASPAYLRLPLDRAWASADVIFVDQVVLEDIGSDHRPLQLRFAIKPNSNRVRE